ncbi:MAG: nucleotidyltransferase family protein [Oscillospiraceae bacterium]|nr:nucleotidyltransferase family protein [Oscillospiraceae bacterium]
MLQEETICGLILAAGLSTRMGDFKPLMPFRGKTLIENTVDSVFSSGARQVVVVTGHRAEELEPLLAEKYGSRVILTRNPDFATTDMLHSIRTGCACLPECDAFFLMPGDMPVVRESTFRKILAQRDGTLSVIFPTLDGYRKHPPLVDYRLIPEILAFGGDGGLRQFWKEREAIIRTVPVDDEGVWVDLDTREDYKKCKEQYEKKR